MLVIWGCTKEDNSKIRTGEAYIIGVDPCSIGRGYVLFLSKSKETVLTYYLPPDLTKDIDLQEIGALEEGYRFSKEFNRKFKLQISYHFASEEEYIIPLCITILDLSGISKITKQIVIDPQKNYLGGISLSSIHTD